MTKAQAQAIIDDVLANDGGTFKQSVIDNAVAKWSCIVGYQVSVDDIAKVKVELFTPQLLISIIKYRESISCRWQQIGFWVNKGYVYIDNTEWFGELDIAIKNARMTNQDSIWDWSTMSSIKVDAQ